MNATNALEISGLTKTFNGFTLDNITFTLPSGCILGLVGENGAGKTTTIKLILNMLRKDSGTVTIFGRDNGADMRALKEDIGVVLDDVGLPECLTAKQVGKVMEGTFSRWDGSAYDRLLKTLSLPENKPFGTLSRGMKMKLGLAVALSHGSRLLLLDEATAGLDPVVRDEVVQMLSDFTRDENHAVLMSSHIVSDLEKLCDYVAFLHKGKLLLWEEKDALLEKYGLLHCTAAQLAALPPQAVKHKKETPYGVEAMVLRRYVPGELRVSPISIEELFIFMAKEAK